MIRQEKNHDRDYDCLPVGIKIGKTNFGVIVAGAYGVGGQHNE